MILNLQMNNYIHLIISILFIVMIYNIIGGRSLVCWNAVYMQNACICNQWCIFLISRLYHKYGMRNYYEIFHDVTIDVNGDQNTMCIN